MRRLLVVLLVAAACSSGPPTVGARFAAPTAVAPFMGFTTKRTTADGSPSAYLAVASSGSDDLRIIDVADDQPALGPGVVFPLSVPTEPRPLMLASASPDPPTESSKGKADLLVAVSAGSHDLQLVKTWSPELSVASTISLTPDLLDADATILSLRAMVVTPPGGQSFARVLVGASKSATSTARLVVVDFARQDDGSLVKQSSNVQPLAFDPVDIATPAPDEVNTPEAARLTSDEAMLIFLATPDPITQVGDQPIHGVAEVASTADASQPWTVTALDAKAPTSAVAAAKISERSTDPNDANAPEHYDPTPALRVYALLDRSGCGQDRAIDCGVVTLRAVTNAAAGTVGTLETDPSGQMPYRAPMLQVPGVPLSIAVAKPVAKGAAQFTSDAYNASLQFPLQSIVENGTRSTTAVAAVSSSDGHVYLLDLARWGLFNGTALLKEASSNVAVTSAQSVLPSINATQLGLWNDFPANAKASSAATAVTTGSDMASFVQVTPGYTDSDTWLITWQGALPQLSARQGILASDGTNLYAAIQSADSQLVDGQLVDVQVGAPELGVEPGDIVEFPEHPSCEATVSAVLPPSPSLQEGGVAMPGGALQLVPLPCQGGLPAAPSSIRMTVRAAGLVLTSTKLGQIGRPQVGAPGDDTNTFRFAWQDESTLSGVDLVRVRKARRHFYPTDPACAAPGCYPGLPWLQDPLAPGPALAFKVGLVDASGTPTQDAANIPRGAYIQLVTRSGISPIYRGPSTGGTVPGTPVRYDKTRISGHENDPVHFYVPYLDDQLIDFSPADSPGSVTTIR